MYNLKPEPWLVQEDVDFYEKINFLNYNIEKIIPALEDQLGLSLIVLVRPHVLPILDAAVLVAYEDDSKGAKREEKTITIVDDFGEESVELKAILFPIASKKLAGVAEIDWKSFEPTIMEFRLESEHRLYQEMRAGKREPEYMELVSEWSGSYYDSIHLGSFAITVASYGYGSTYVYNEPEPGSPEYKAWFKTFREFEKFWYGFFFSAEQLEKYNAKAEQYGGLGL